MMIPQCTCTVTKFITQTITTAAAAVALKNAAYLCAAAALVAWQLNQQSTAKHQGVCSSICQ
jgi:hypothetical protein